jgi:hypothetical protein
MVRYIVRRVMFTVALLLMLLAPRTAAGIVP